MFYQFDKSKLTIIVERLKLGKLHAEVKPL